MGSSASHVRSDIVQLAKFLCKGDVTSVVETGIAEHADTVLYGAPETVGF